MNNKSDSTLRAILIPPEKWLISQFTSRRSKRKVIHSRPVNDKNPSYIVINEWREFKILRWLLLLPITIIALLFFAIILLTAGPVYLFNKKKGDKVAKFYFAILNAIAAQGPYFTKYDFQAYADKLIKQNENRIQRILYVHISQKSLLFHINPELAINFIDQIWIYNNFFDIAYKLQENNYSKQNSIIVDYEIVSQYNLWKEAYLKEKHRIRRIEWTENIDIDNILKPKPKTTTKIKSPLSNADKIKLKPNDFLHNDVVLYFEPSYNPTINRYLSSHYDRINDALKKKGMTFYYPARIIQSTPRQPDHELTAYLQYRYPELVDTSKRLNENTLTSAIDEIELSAYYSSLCETLGLSDLKRPCLIHSVEADNKMSEFREYVYSVYYLSGNFSAELGNEINKYLSLVRIPKNEVFFSLRSPDPDDPDDMFNHQGQEVSQELKEIIVKLKERKNENILLDSLIYMIKSFKEVQPELCRRGSTQGTLQTQRGIDKNILSYRQQN